MKAVFKGYIKEFKNLTLNSGDVESQIILRAPLIKTVVKSILNAIQDSDYNSSQELNVTIEVKDASSDDLDTHDVIRYSLQSK